MPTPPEFDNVRVVLVAARNPLNIGAAARAMSNFGFLHLRVVNPYQVAFREAQSAVGASALLANAQEFASVADAVADCSLVIGTTANQHRELQQPLKRLDAAAPIIRERLISSPVAILFGSEKRGLANDDMSHCHWLMHIPTREEHLSMNLGQSVAICLYELARKIKPVPQRNAPLPATSADVERVSDLMMQLLLASDYLKNPKATNAAQERLRRLVLRLNLSQQDADIWLGMLRKIWWKLSPGNSGE